MTETEWVLVKLYSNKNKLFKWKVSENMFANVFSTYMRRNHTDNIGRNNSGHSANGGSNAHQNTREIRTQVERVNRDAGHTLEHNRYSEIDDDH